MRRGGPIQPPRELRKISVSKVPAQSAAAATPQHMQCMDASKLYGNALIPALAKTWRAKKE